MVTKTVSVICFTLLFIIHTLVPKALSKNSNVDEFMVEDRRTHRRQNYVVQRALDNEVLGDGVEVPYVADGVHETSPEELPALIVDYANMIRNDIILLDNSVETRTRKRGNIKVEKHNQAIPDTPCSCEYGKELKDLNEVLGEDVYPRVIETSSCNESLCPPPYNCERNYYNITILVSKRKGLTIPSDLKMADIPGELKHRWVAVKYPVTVGCICKKDYIQPN